MRILAIPVALLLLACGTAAVQEPPPPTLSQSVVTPQALQTSQPPRTSVTTKIPTIPLPTSTPYALKPTSELIPNLSPTATLTPITIETSVPEPTPIPFTEPTSATADTMVAIPTPAPVQEPEPQEVALTAVQGYGAWCQETQGDLTAVLSGTGEATWGEFQELLVAMQRFFRSVEPPAELRDYHDFTTDGFGDLEDMVDFAYQAVNLEGVPLNITEETVLVEDELLAVVVLFAFEKMDSGRPLRILGGTFQQACRTS